MPNKPVHEHNSYNCKAGLWQHMRRLKQFTLDEIYKEGNMNKRTIQQFIQGLVKAGYLKIVKEKKQGKLITIRTYKVVKSPRDVPRVRKDGTEVTMGKARLQMWRTMKVLKTFDVRELVVNASTEEIPVNESDAKYYLRYLVKAGYVAVVKQGKGTGNGGVLSVYRLKPGKWTGPKAPMIQNVKHVF